MSVSHTVNRKEAFELVRKLVEVLAHTYDAQIKISFTSTGILIGTILSSEQKVTKE